MEPGKTAARIERIDRRTAADWTVTFGLPFAIVLYFSLRGGGYDEIVRSQAAIAIWALLGIGALIGLVPRSRPRGLALAALVLLAALAGWTALSMVWSESAERSFQEVARLTTYLGIFALGLALQGADGVRRALTAVAAAIAVVAGLALLSRLHPEWFPADEAAEAVPAIAGRLNYPLNYWNGLAALIAMGIPLVLVTAADSRRLAVQVLASMALPVMAVAAFLTVSRSGWIELLAALVVVFAFHPSRFAMLPTFLIGVISSALAILLVSSKDALETAPGTALAESQGSEMLLIMFAVCAITALARVGLELADRRAFLPLPPMIKASRRAMSAGAAAVAIVVVAGAIAVGLPEELSDRWEEFKSPVNLSADSGRFASASGNGRYLYWQAALDENASAPVAGTGAGTYEFWWARHSTTASPGFINTAHSLYLEVLGELGVVGFAFLLALLGVIGYAGVTRTIRCTDERERGLLAAGVASFVAFLLAMGVDWGWDLVPIPAAMLMIAAAFLIRPPARADEDPDPGPPPRRERFALVAVSVLGVALAFVSLRGASLISDSQEAVRASDLETALDKAHSAEAIQPFSATPHLQQALVLEVQEDYEEAAAEATIATEKEETNWRTWLTLSRIEQKRGRAEAAEAAYERARSLNPISPIFADAPDDEG